MENLSPHQIVAELDKHIIGQNDAKRAVAIALRDRWRRQKLDEQLREEVLPKNILMIGPTGVGKTEVSRRLAKLADAPFVKVEATKFTEVGYVGRDVEQIVRDLVEVGISLAKHLRRESVEEVAKERATQRIIDALVGKDASPATRKSFMEKVASGEFDDREIEIEVRQSVSPASFEVPGMPGAQVGMINIGDMLGKAFGGGPKKKRQVKVKDSYKMLISEEIDRLLDQDEIAQDAISLVENNGIVFIDEIDKISRRSDSRQGGDVSREGVQRDLLPLLEGTTVSTKYGPVKTEHVLFIASGAFHVSKPSDLLPELQGRLPIRVELKPLNKDDFRKILAATEFNLIKQYCALIGTEGFDLSFSDDAIEEIAEIAVEVNSKVENIGARRLQTVMERILDDISFNASERAGEKIVITREYVREHIGDLVDDVDLSRYVL